MIVHLALRRVDRAAARACAAIVAAQDAAVVASAIARRRPYPPTENAHVDA